MNARTLATAAVCCTLSAALPAHRLYAQTPAPAPAASAGQDMANDLVVSVGKAVLVDTTSPVERIAVGSSDIAEATAVSPTEVMLNGKAAGETSLIVWQQGGGRQFFNVQVHPNNYATTDKLDSVRRELRTELPNQPLKLTSENGLVFLRGTVKDLNSSDRAVQIASTAGKVVNLLYVEVPAAEPQILLKVRFATLDRTKSRQLGLNVFSLDPNNGIGTLTTQQFSPPSVSLPSGSTGAVASLSNLLNIFIFRPDANVGATIEALEQKGIAEVLAEPNVLTANGKQGSILAGGQYPYPVVQGVNGTGGTAAVTISFKEFGVRLNFIPTITPRNTIRLQVAPEVSSLDIANGVTISGFTVPGLDIRRVKTEVELAQGQSFAIGGLLDNRENDTLSKIPFIGDVPILGKFFQSQSRTKTNSELIVIVTPEIVNPIPAGSALPSIHYPETFLERNDNVPMQNPETAGQNTAAPAPTMPVEKLVDSMKPEQPLVIDGSTGFGASGGGAASSGVTTNNPQ